MKHPFTKLSPTLSMVTMTVIMDGVIYWLVLYTPTPLKNDGKLVSWDYELPDIWKTCSSHHQAVTISLAKSSQVRQVRWTLATKKIGTSGGHP